MVAPADYADLADKAENNSSYPLHPRNRRLIDIELQPAGGHASLEFSTAELGCEIHFNPG